MMQPKPNLFILIALASASVGIMEATRRSHVQQLRNLAAKYEVPRVPDKAKRDLVTQMAQAIRAVPSLTAKDLKALAQHWKDFKATYPDAWDLGWEPNDDEGESPQPQENDEAPQDNKKWRFRVAITSLEAIVATTVVPFSTRPCIYEYPMRYSQ